MSFDDWAGSPSKPATNRTSSSNTLNYSSGRSSAPQWESLQQRVETALKQLSSAIPQIQRLIAKVGTSEDTAEHRHSIRERIVSTQAYVKECNEALECLAPLLDQASSEEERNRWRRSFQKLKGDFEKSAHSYVELSKMWLEKDRKTQVQPSRRSTASTFDEPPQSDERRSLLSEQNRQQFYYVESDLKVNEVIIREREEEIIKIEQAVVEVNDMFRDLSMLVNQASPMIDSIEAHIEEAVVQSEKGVEELKQAEQYQKAGNSKQCIIIAIIVCVVIVIVVLAALGVGLSFTI